MAKLKRTAVDNNREEAVAKIKAYEASNPFPSPPPPLPGHKTNAQRSGRPAAGGGRCEPSQRRRSRSAQPSEARAGDGGWLGVGQDRVSLQVTTIRY